jgi:hypothetical protein
MKWHSLLNPNRLLIGVIACLLVMGIPSVMAAVSVNAASSEGGTILVTSDPAGAAVSLNGEYQGVTPAEYKNLPPGDYSITVELAGYHTETIPTHLWDGSRREILVHLENLSSVPTATATPGPLSRYGSIAVDSTPGGANVSLDGVAAGRTPLTHTALILNSVPVGSHTLRVELAGYPPFTRSVTVIKNQVLRINADLAASNQSVSSTLPATVSETDTVSMARTAPTRQSGIPLVLVIVAVGLAGFAAVFRRS